METAQKGKLFKVLFEALSPTGLSTVTGLAGSITKQLRVVGSAGNAAEVVTITEQGTSGYYEASFTPLQGDDDGVNYRLVITEPNPDPDNPITAGRRLTYSIESFLVSPVSTPLSGNFLTSLANVKEYLGITVNDDDALLTNLIGRVSTMIQTYLSRHIVPVTLTEYHNGRATPFIKLDDKPLRSLTSIHESLDQIWDSTTIISNSEMLIDYDEAILCRKSGICFMLGFRNVRTIYDAGYLTIPSDIEQVAIELVGMKYVKKDRLGISSKTLRDGSRTFFSHRDMTQKMFDDLAPYRNEILVI